MELIIIILIATLFLFGAVGSDLFKGINYQGYGFWSFPKDKPLSPFLIGLMYLLMIPIGGLILFLSFGPGFWLRDFFYDKGFFEEKGFGSLMVSLVAFYFTIYLLYKAANYIKIKKNNSPKSLRKKRLQYLKSKNKNKLKNKPTNNYQPVKDSYPSAYKSYENDLSKETLKKESSSNTKLSELESVKNNLTRDEIIKRLKETKELFDEGILSKEEYEKETSKLKHLLLGN